MKRTTDKHGTHMFIGIDPGASGGIAGICRTSLGNIIRVLKPFKNTEEANNNVKECLKYNPTTIVACIENVHAFPTDGRSSAFKFGKNAGIWEGLLTSYDIPYFKVVPHQWMSYYGELPKDKSERKRMLKEKAKEVVADIGSLEDIKRVTLKTADALLIANYFIEKEKEWLK